MASISRLGGAILCKTGDAFYLVGNLKEPCDFAAVGFEPPAGEIDAVQQPYVRLSPTRAISLAAPLLKVELEGEALPRVLAERLVIQRNGSVSDRLWRVIVHGQDGAGEIDARWLTETPTHIWQIVRDAILKCS